MMVVTNNDKSPNTVIEILTLSLKPGVMDQFHRLYVSESLPLQKKWDIEVVDHGPSPHIDASYYVIRAFRSEDDRQKTLDAFYNSEDWQKGPRTAILAMIDHIATLVIPPETIKEWLNRI